MTRTLLLALLLPLSAFAEAVVFKIGTLAPRESPWGQVFRVWEKAVKQKSGDKVQLQFFWNGTQGDEAAMVGKMKTGQLDGAAITAVGLGVIHRETTVLQMPGVFQSWRQVDLARDKLKARFEPAFKSAGFTLVGWGDVGVDRFFSKGFPVAKPADLKGKRPWVWRDDPVAVVTLQSIGEVVPVPTGVPEVLPELTVGNINAMQTSALAAEQLQWSSRLDHVTDIFVAPSIGAIVLSSKKLESLPKELKEVVLDTGRIAAKALTDRIRAEDEKAFERLKKRMTVVKPDLEAWQKNFSEARARLAQGVFPAELVKEVESAAK